MTYLVVQSLIIKRLVELEEMVLKSYCILFANQDQNIQNAEFPDIEQVKHFYELPV